MASITGLARPGRQKEGAQMLNKMSHRGKDRVKMLEKGNVTMQAAWSKIQSRPTPPGIQMNTVWDGISAPFPDLICLAKHAEPFAMAAFSP